MFPFFQHFHSNLVRGFVEFYLSKRSHLKVVRVSSLINVNIGTTIERRGCGYRLLFQSKILDINTYICIPRPLKLVGTISEELVEKSASSEYWSWKIYCSWRVLSLSGMLFTILNGSEFLIMRFMMISGRLLQYLTI